MGQAVAREGRGRRVVGADAGVGVGFVRSPPSSPPSRVSPAPPVVIVSPSVSPARSFSDVVRGRLSPPLPPEITPVGVQVSAAVEETLPLGVSLPAPAGHPPQTPAARDISVGAPALIEALVDIGGSVSRAGVDGSAGVGVGSV